MKYVSEEWSYVINDLASGVGRKCRVVLRIAVFVNGTCFTGFLRYWCVCVGYRRLEGGEGTQ